MSLKKKNKSANHAEFSPCRYEVDEARHISTKNSKNNPVVVKTVLHSNCKNFRDTALPQNFNLKPEIQIKKHIPITEATKTINTLK